MRRSELVLALLCLFVISSCQQESISVIPETTNVGKVIPISFGDVYPEIDSKLRKDYWYYLRASNLIYQANVDTPDTFLFFAIYRNIVGTFLVITTWEKSLQSIQVNTFVRLGNGYQEGSGALFEPVRIDPYIISLKLEEDEFVLTINDDGTLSISGGDGFAERSQGSSFEAALEADMSQKCGAFSKRTQDKYWYFLQDASEVLSSQTPTNKKYYCVNTYVNIVGTFLAIGSYDRKTEIDQVLTLVRLGNGFKDGSGAKYGPIEIHPSVLEIHPFQA